MTPRRDELLADLAVLRDHLEKRPVGVADLQDPQEIAVRQATLREVRLGVFPLAEGPVVVLHDPRQDGCRRRAMWGRALGRGLRGRSALAVAWRRQRGQRRPLLDPWTLLHEPPEIEPGALSQRLEAPPKLTLSCFVTKPMTSPETPQPKQWKSPFAEETLKDAVFSP